MRLKLLLLLLLLLLCVLIFTQGCVSANAEDAKMKEKTYVIADFTEVKIGMSYNEVFDLVDSPVSIDGFNFKWLIYNLNDGSQMKLGFLPSNLLMTMDIIDPDGRVFSLKQEDK